MACQKQDRAVFGAQAVGENANAGIVPILATQTQPLATGESPNQTSRQGTVYPLRKTE
jgi:hypothetical protein